MNKANSIEPYWEDDPGISSYEVQWRDPAEDSGSPWYHWGGINDSTDERAIEIFQEIRESRKSFGTKFRLIKTVRKIYHDSGF